MRNHVPSVCLLLSGFYGLMACADAMAETVSVPARDHAAKSDNVVPADQGWDKLVVTHGNRGMQEWAVQLDKGGPHFIHFQYASGESRPVRLAINGREQLGKFLAKQTGGFFAGHLIWETYGPFELKPGKNSIRITVDGVSPHLAGLVISDDRRKWDKDAFAKLVPKPGAWMETFKHFMGFLLLGTVVYLFTFLPQEIVWPTERDRVKGAKFTTEEFIDAIVKDVGKRLDLDRRKVLTLSWSSGGPAAYAAAFRKRTPITGSFVAMSVFYPAWFPNLKPAKGKPFYILHSPEDDVCRFPLAEDARDRLGTVGARVEFETYEGGHGWPPATRYELLTAGFRWLDEQVSKER